MSPSSSAVLNEASIFDAVQEMYEDVAVTPTKEFHFPTGRSSCLYLGYPESELDALPVRAVESFAGVGYPFLPEEGRRATFQDGTFEDGRWVVPE